MPATEVLSKDRLAKVRLAKKTIDEHLKALAEEMRQGKSEELIRYLTVFAQFHHYSFGNLMLAMSQRPNITWLAGIRQWNKLGRTVIPGEHGIMIIAPMNTNRAKKTELQGEDNAKDKSAKKDEREEEAQGELKPQESVTYFKVVHVFDLAQTQGKALPELKRSEGDASTLLPLLERIVQQDSIQLEYVEVIQSCPGALGVSFGGRVEILATLAEADRFRTLAHEYAHERLHQSYKHPDKRIRETEADATAYVVCQHFGIECNTSDYLLLYAANPELLYQRLETVRCMASMIINQLEEGLK